ncbi:MAG: PLP-dependent aminotransferase family protein [Actinobacteria bacterium]|nr:MAG: PLP-dependent aminotransferase family protein [Actinomycetota bacterium]
MTISLARGIPSPDCLPVEELADCAREALRRDGQTILSYGSTLGYEPLREWIGERHGVPPERVVVTNGSLQAFHFVLASLGPGAVVVERPTYDRPRKILFAEGREVTEIAIDDDGLDVDALEANGSAALLYTIPTFQNPSGVTLSEERRRRLAALVRERELPVLEDDPYGLVRFEGVPLPSLLELEGGEHVRYSSSFSKTVAPGLRVGYLIVSTALASGLQGLAASTYITPGLVAQATLHEFLRRGLFESNVRRVCDLLRERRDTMLEALEHDLAGRARWSRPEGGYFLWLELPEDLDASELLTRAQKSGVTFVPGTDFGGEPNTLRLAFSYVSPDEITEGIGRLAKLVASAAAPV